MEKTHVDTSACLLKQEKLSKLFAHLPSSEAKYEKIMEMGKNLPPLSEACRTEKHLVPGCQSIVYLRAYLGADGHSYFEIHSEALISSGLAALLLYVYNGEPPEVILTCPPTFIQELGLLQSLSPGRSNGLASMFQAMRKEALLLLTN